MYVRITTQVNLYILFDFSSRLFVCLSMCLWLPKRSWICKHLRLFAHVFAHLCRWMLEHATARVWLCVYICMLKCLYHRMPARPLGGASVCLFVYAPLLAGCICVCAYHYTSKLPCLFHCFPLMPVAICFFPLHSFLPSRIPMNLYFFVLLDVPGSMPFLWIFSYVSNGCTSLRMHFGVSVCLFAS